MKDEEKRIITAFLERLSGNAPVQGAPSGPWGASTAQKQNLPPMDLEACPSSNDLRPIGRLCNGVSGPSAG
jgi:hypothetical protein